MSMTRDVVRKVVLDATLFALSNLAVYYAIKYVMGQTDPTKNTESKGKGAEVMARLGLKNVKLNEYEERIAAEVVHPDDINVGFDDIGGLDSIIASLKESVILPLVYPTLFAEPSSLDDMSQSSATNSSLLSPPKGVLLYGPPGCGKTLLARALARESRATFINLPISVLTDKWYGESNKLVRGLFGLARKLQPSIVFIDEIDCFLRERGRGNDHEATGMMKAEFMTLWDGLLTQNDRIVVLGATNRPEDIDQAILRRMPKRFPVGLPDYEQRKNILKLMLPPAFPAESIHVLAECTPKMSGSDLKELCRNAAMTPLREYMRQHGGSPEELAKAHDEGLRLRPLQLEDFFGDDRLKALKGSRGNVVEEALD
ncbi:hypothetical protein BOTBODRAFT_31090 [Botryobasidium botryosum FD-172 SS1]|uniref:AAA+ ATPase domain-containing protein n=1 Tax=Botryobasidium botryosum (strain FD-172 SS1) TaxID=930990 RepID=A0A067MMQ1_BOTB1|nr:hypothetical protein BOTBODRAFT_31090 [Botryobasidium botryosum FD-172 SS1]